MRLRNARQRIAGDKLHEVLRRPTSGNVCIDEKENIVPVP